MKRRVILTISGLHSGVQTEDGRVETVVEAEYFKKNDTHYLLYDEAEEGCSQISKSRIKFRSNILELTRQGVLNTHMVFEEGKKHMTTYRTPYGHMVLGIETSKVAVEEQEKHICVKAEYVLEAGGAHLSHSSIVIRVKEA